MSKETFLAKKKKTKLPAPFQDEGSLPTAHKSHLLSLLCLAIRTAFGWVYAILDYLVKLRKKIFR